MAIWTIYIRPACDIYATAAQKEVEGGEALIRDKRPPERRWMRRREKVKRKREIDYIMLQR